MDGDQVVRFCRKCGQIKPIFDGVELEAGESDDCRRWVCGDCVQLFHTDQITRKAAAERALAPLPSPGLRGRRRRGGKQPYAEPRVKRAWGRRVQEDDFRAA